MKRFKIFYYIKLLGEGGHKLVFADTEEKAIEIFKTQMAKQGNPEPEITGVKEL